MLERIESGPFELVFKLQEINTEKTNLDELEKAFKEEKQKHEAKKTKLYSSLFFYCLSLSPTPWPFYLPSPLPLERLNAKYGKFERKEEGLKKIGEELAAGKLQLEENKKIFCEELQGDLRKIQEATALEGAEKLAFLQEKETFSAADLAADKIFLVMTLGLDALHHLVDNEELTHSMLLSNIEKFFPNFLQDMRMRRLLAKVRLNDKKSFARNE